MTSRELSLAAGTVLDLTPEDAVGIAAAAGYEAAGLWFDAERWTASTTRAVASRLAHTGIRALDIEPVILGRGVDHGEQLVDLAVELGVPHVLVASGGAPRARVVDRLVELADHAAGSPVRLVLEFLPIFSVATLGDAVSIVEDVGHDRVGVLVDTLHLDRSGGSPDELAAVAANRLPYLQLADAPAARPDSFDTLRDEALHGRLLPGEGALPLVEVLRVLPGVPVSVELRSRALMTDHPDPLERARVVLAATRRVLGATR